MSPTSAPRANYFFRSLLYIQPWFLFARCARARGPRGTAGGASFMEGRILSRTPSYDSWSSVGSDMSKAGLP